VGNPINMLTGVKKELVTDFQGGGRLEWTRHYSSQVIISDKASSLGNNWRHGYSHHLTIADTATTGFVLVNRPSGDQYLFNRGLSGAWLADADVPYELVPVEDAGTRVGWRISAPDRTEEHYDPAGRLQAITWPGGDSVHLVYSDDELVRVEDRQGRSIEISYADDLLDIVRLPDGKVIKYGFDANRRLTSVGLQKNEGGVPGFDVVEYRYEDANHVFALTGRTDEHSALYATWEYDSQGRATRSTHGGQVDEVLVEYTPNGSIVTNPLGEASTHSGAVMLGRSKLTGSSKGCVDCGGAYQSRTYDSNGYPDFEVDFRGKETDYDYDAHGLELQRIEAVNDATGGRRKIQTDWHATMRVQTSRRVYDDAGALLAKSDWTYNAQGQPLTTTQTDPDILATRTSTTTYCEPSDIATGTCPLLGLVTSTDGAHHLPASQGRPVENHERLGPGHRNLGLRRCRPRAVGEGSERGDHRL
jgi:hypothetical protein